MMKTYKFIVSGLVQGVYFRKSISLNAKKENFTGYVKNLPNGDVEAVANLTDSNYSKFIEILNSGSSVSRTDNIDIEELEYSSFLGFEIRY